MERLNPTAALQNEQTRTLSQNRQSSTANIPAEQHAALFALINKARMLNGWTMRSAADLDATIRTWAEQFNQYRIPPDRYGELYRRAFNVRQAKMRDGDLSKVPALDATLLVSCWTGEHGLAAELERKRVESRRYLPDTAASDCPKCYGSGFEVVPGKGARRCAH